MKPIILFSIALLVPAISHAMPGYVEDDLKHFLETHVCEDCNLVGAGIIGRYPNSKLHGTLLDGAALTHDDFSMSDFSSAKMNIVNASSACFASSDFSNAQMTQSSFSYSDFSNANFKGAIVTGTYFTGANFLGSNISMEQLQSAGDICGAILPDGTKKEC